MIIAIDGPAASGKSTTAKMVAGKLDYLYLDTGAMYRTVTYHFLREKVNIENPGEIAKSISNLNLSIGNENNTTKIFLGGEDITALIRTTEVTNHVSKVSALRVVREEMVSLQRNLMYGQNAVVEGRDIGSVVFPDAKFKFYITADVKTRAERRYHDLKKIDEELSVEEIVKDLKRRDQYDSSRDHSPLAKAEDAIEIDTTKLTVDEQVRIICNHINNNLKKERQ
tara:strand:- start:9491 stop:10165 length:675 start_codon:yes stop_codon:yes gene_type:complete